MVRYVCYTSPIEPKHVKEALLDDYWMNAMEEELEQFVEFSPSFHPIYGTLYSWRTYSRLHKLPFQTFLLCMCRDVPNAVQEALDVHSGTCRGGEQSE